MQCGIFWKYASGMTFLSFENNNSYNKQQLLGNVKTWNFKIINWNTIATDITFYKQYWITKWNITDNITSLMLTQGNTEISFFFSWAMGVSMKNWESIYTAHHRQPMWCQGRVSKFWLFFYSWTQVWKTIDIEKDNHHLYLFLYFDALASWSFAESGVTDPLGVS